MVRKEKLLRFLSRLWHADLRGFFRPIRFCTAADETHSNSLLQFLHSVEVLAGTQEVFVWNLGLSEEHLALIEKRFSFVKLRNFDFAAYPAYFDIKREAGQYAWKPTLIEMTLGELDHTRFRGILVWCDAGNVIQSQLRWVRMLAARNGVFSPFSAGQIKDWTHPATVDYFSLDSRHLVQKNANGAFVAIDSASVPGRWLIKSWSQLAQVERVIAPPGSNRANHRQDQAVLSCLLEKNQMLPRGRYREIKGFGFRIQLDVD